MVPPRSVIEPGIPQEHGVLPEGQLVSSNVRLVMVATDALFRSLILENVKGTMPHIDQRQLNLQHPLHLLVLQTSHLLQVIKAHHFYVMPRTSESKVLRSRLLNDLELCCTLTTLVPIPFFSAAICPLPTLRREAE